MESFYKEAELQSLVNMGIRDTCISPSCEYSNRRGANTVSTGIVAREVKINNKSPALLSSSYAISLKCSNSHGLPFLQQIITNPSGLKDY